MTPEEKEKVKFLNELKEFWNWFPYYLEIQWEKIPSLFRSLIQIIIWTSITAVWIAQMPPISKWGWVDIPQIYVTVFLISLGIFYTYHEIRTQWKRYHG